MPNQWPGTVHNWSHLEHVLSTDLDTLHDAVMFLYDPPRGKWTISADGSPATGVTATVAWDVTVYDGWGMLNPANDTQVLIPVAGTYLLTAEIDWVAGGIGYRRMDVRVNGGAVSTPVEPSPSANNAIASVTNTAVAQRCAVGDVITVTVEQTSGGNFAYDPNQGRTHLSVSWIGS